MNTPRSIEINGRARMLSLIFLEDDKHLLSGGDEPMIRQWRVADGMEIGEGMKTSGIVTAMALSGDSKWIISTGERVANAWSMKSRQIVITVSEHSDWVDAVHVSPDSTKFATGSNDKRAFIWDILTGKRLVGPLEHEDRVGAVRFSPDGDRIATGTASGMLRIYDTHHGELLRTIPVSVPSYPSNLITWSSPWSIFALVSKNTLMHMDVNTGQTFSSWTIPGDPVTHFWSIAFGSIVSSNNSKFIVSFVGRSISLWDTSTSARISADIQHPTHIWSIALSSDDKRLAIGDANGKMIVRSLNDIISNYYLVGRRMVQQPQNRNREDPPLQNEDLHGRLRALELRFDELSRGATRTHELLRAEQPIPLHISDGTYRIKSKAGNLYLACSLDDAGAVFVQSDRRDKSSVFQVWTISPVADGAYSIMRHRGNSDALSVGNANALVCFSGGRHATWTIEPRGDSYVIGNAEDTTAIHLTQPSRTVSVAPRDNSQNQRWVLEHLADGVMQ
ncbi:WD40-repeat-containing domain protein [Boletus edulis]|nr:WD40-repeat-containing domain protein [Boletus edulis]